MLPPSYSKLPKSFWAKVKPSPNSDCWIWAGSHHPKGYGAVHIYGRGLRSHRVSAEDKHGSIPEGLFVLHHCDVRNCVNPDHLYYGTAQDNADDAKKRGRQTRGEKQAASKLTDAKVIKARELYSTGRYTYAGLARENGVTPKTMQAVIKRERWKHL